MKLKIIKHMKIDNKHPEISNFYYRKYKHKFYQCTEHIKLTKMYLKRFSY